MKRLTLALVACNLLWGSLAAQDRYRDRCDDRFCAPRAEITNAKKPTAVCRPGRVTPYSDVDVFRFDCHFRRELTEERMKRIRAVEGVAHVSENNKYSFFFYVGELFDAKEVVAKVMEEGDRP